MQRAIAYCPLSRRGFTGAALFGLVLIGFCRAAAADPTSLFVPTASGYFLSAATPATRNQAPRPTMVGSVQWASGTLDAGNGCGARGGENPFCELRWATDRKRASDIEARYDEVTENVMARILGASRAEYFDLDLDSSPKLRFKLKF